MKTNFVGACAAAIVAGAVSLGATSALANTYNITVSGSDSDGPISASAIVTTGANTLSIVLTSNINPTGGDGQLVSGILLTLGNANITSDTLSSATGTTINFSGNSVLPDPGPITHWGTSFTSTTICLETAGSCAQGGKPQYLIVGPGPYSLPINSSIDQHDPSIQGTGTFLLAVNGITSNSTITAATFEFGTGPTGRAGTITAGVPEPSTWAMMLLGFAGLGFAFRQTRRKVSFA